MRILVADSHLPIPDVVRPDRNRHTVGVAGAGRSGRAEPGPRHRLDAVRGHRCAGSRFDAVAERSSVR